MRFITTVFSYILVIIGNELFELVDFGFIRSIIINLLSSLLTLFEFSQLLSFVSSVLRHLLPLIVFCCYST